MTDHKALIERLRGYRAVKSWYELYLLITEAADALESLTESRREVDRTAVARAIAAGLGDDFDSAFEGKSAWVAARGQSETRYRDVNEPFQHDYLAAADAVLALATTSDKLGDRA